MTGLVDLDAGRLLDVVDGRAGTSVAGWLQQRDDGWLSAVRRVALDPHRGYLNALLDRLDAPTAVVDAFHVIKLANTVVDEVRRRVQQDEMGHRGHEGDPLYGIRRTLLVGTERLTDKGKARLEAALVAGDPDCEVWYAHHVKELLRRVYRADAHDEAADRLEEFHQACQFVEIPRSDDSPAPCAAGTSNYSPTGDATASPTARPRPSTRSSSASSASATDSATSPTTASDCCCSAASPHGRINPPRDCEALATFHEEDPGKERNAARICLARQRCDVILLMPRVQQPCRPLLTRDIPIWIDNKLGTHRNPWAARLRGRRGVLPPCPPSPIAARCRWTDTPSGGALNGYSSTARQT